MTTVRDLIRSKRAVWTVRPDAPVYEALQLLAQRDVGALLVMTDGKLIGILSERDYARKVVLQGKSSHDIPVREIMTSDVVTVRPDQSVEECM